MFQVIKRDGSEAAFCLDKIGGAIIKAFNATQIDRKSTRLNSSHR